MASSGTIVAAFDPATGFGWGPLAEDAKGDLFVLTGTTASGGSGSGAVYEIANTATGYASTPTLLATLPADETDPAGPLFVDAKGDLFGLTDAGGSSGDGTIFEIANTPTGYAGTITLLGSFSGSDGVSPFGPLIEDANGDLYGTTFSYIQNGVGAGEVFELANTSSGYASTPSVLAQFDVLDGLQPRAGLVADAEGDLFGTTQEGGSSYGEGTVFEIANTPTGYASTPQDLFIFDGDDGSGPTSPLLIDAKGDLFGTTYIGGDDALGNPSGDNPANGDGVVFEIVNTPTGYASTPITIFFNGADGALPSSNLVEDAAGDLFGETVSGPGTVFEIENTSTGLASTPITLLTLGGNLGTLPDGTLLADANGDLIGATEQGGPNGDGAVFEIPAAFINAPSSPGGMLDLKLQQTQSVSLDQLSLNPAIAPSGIINWVVVEGPGTATVNGIVSINTLEVAGGVLALGGGTLLTDPVTIDANGDVTGYGTISGVTTNNGTVTAVGGSLDLTGSIAGAGTLVIDNAATLELGNAVGGQQLVQFDTTAVSGTGVLLLDDPIQFSGTIAAHVAGDSIVVNPSDAMLTAGTLDISGHILTLLGSIVGGGAGPIGTVTFANAISANSFTVADNTVELACFAAGTQLATPAGLVAVERLTIGDKVTTLLGGSGRIVWIGTRTVACARHPRPEAVWPVRIRKDAFGPDAPHQDLWLSPDHAVFVEDVLIPIRNLINGTTVVQEKRDSVRYFHVELQAHDVLLAEGLACESFLDTGNRTDFDNAGPVVRMHPELAVRAWDALGCAPLVVYGTELAAARKCLTARAALLGRAIAA